MFKHQDENIKKEAIPTETAEVEVKKEDGIAKTPTWTHLLKFALPTMLWSVKITLGDKIREVG